MLLEADVPDDAFISVRAVGSGTAALAPELAEAFEDRYGIPVLTNYGATEFAGAIDADGFLFIHGRADDAINRGGFKIAPE